MSGAAESLIARWVEGDLDDDGRCRLAEALAADPALARTAAEQARFAALLRLAWPEERGRDTAASVEALIRARRPSQRLRLVEAVEGRVGHRRRNGLRWPALVAAAVVIASAIALWPGAAPAPLTIVSGEALLLAQQALGEGARIGVDAGAMTIGAVPLVLQGADGSLLRLAAGSRAELHGREADGRLRCTLTAGQVGWQAEHHPGAGGLRLVTPHGSVETAGTVFDCRIVADAAVVRLADGEVRVATGTGDDVVLRPGQASVARTGFPPSAPLPVPAQLVWTGGDPDGLRADRVLGLPWRFVPGLVPAKTVGRWHSLADGTQACTALAVSGQGWESEPRPDHEVMIHAQRDGSAMLRLEHGCVLRFRVRAERSGSINVTIGVPSAEPGGRALWASSAMVPVAAGVWREVELPIAAFWSRVKADWESAAISSLGCWGYGAGGFVVSQVEVLVK